MENFQKLDQNDPFVFFDDELAAGLPRSDDFGLLLQNGCRFDTLHVVAGLGMTLESPIEIPPGRQVLLKSRRAIEARKEPGSNELRLYEVSE